MRRFAYLALLLALGCPKSRLVSADGALRVSTDRLDFGDVWLKATGHRTLGLTNAGTASLQVTLTTDPPFGTDASLTLQGGEHRDVEVRFQPTATGAATATLAVGDGRSRALVALKGNGVTAPACDSTVCRHAELDPGTAECVLTPLPDGTTCADGCVTGTCSNGTCLGTTRSCDDGDPCTQDSCADDGGCVHAAEACPAPDPCHVGACDPVKGCAAVPAEDGTACGDADCVTAHVCIAGSCVERSVPEGAACGSSSLCQLPGVCNAQQCVQPAATPIARAWTYQPSGRATLVGLVADPSGNFYTAECTPGANFTSTCTLLSFDPSGALRWQTPYPRQMDTGAGALTDSFTVVNGLVISFIGRTFVDAFDAGTGALVWSADTLGTAFFANPPSGWVRFTQVGFDGGKRLVLLLESYDMYGGIGPSALVALDVGTGTVLGRVPLPAQGMDFVIDRSANLYLMHAAGNANYDYALTGLDSQWGVRWQQTLSVMQLNNWVPFVRSTHGGVLYVSHHDLPSFWSTSGVKLSATPPPSPGWPSSVWSDDALFTTEQFCPAGMTCNSWADWVYGVVAVNNSNFAQHEWTVPQIYWVLPLWLTSKGTALFEYQADANLPAVAELDRGGKLSMDCALEGLRGLAPVSTPVLTNGQLALLASDTYDDWAGRLFVWPLPGYRPATRGWVSDRGGPGFDSMEH